MQPIRWSGPTSSRVMKLKHQKSIKEDHMFCIVDVFKKNVHVHGENQEGAGQLTFNFYIDIIFRMNLQSQQNTSSSLISCLAVGADTIILRAVGEINPSSTALSKKHKKELQYSSTFRSPTCMFIKSQLGFVDELQQQRHCMYDY